MYAFEGEAAFKGRNVLNTATKRSENLIRQFKFFRVPDPDLKSDTIKQYDSEKLALYLTEYLHEEKDSFSYAQYTQYSLVNDLNATNFGTQRAAKAACDDIEQTLLKSRKKARVVFYWLNKISFDAK